MLTPEVHTNPEMKSNDTDIQPLKNEEYMKLISSESESNGQVSKFDNANS